MKLLKFFCPFILIIPIVGTSCSLNNNFSSILEPGDPINGLLTQKLTFENYFENSIPINVKSTIKKRITDIINNYRLWEWNIYYEKYGQNNSYGSSKSKVLNLWWNDYQENESYQNINNIFDGYEDIYITKIYNKQDKQFQYFNDFVNIINEEKTKNEEDFLYLRWLYYSIDAANLYKNTIYENKHIYEIELNDWIEAIAAAMPPKFDFTKIQNLIKSFLKYYGLDEKSAISIVDQIIENFFPKFKNQNSRIDVDIKFINNSIIHLYLCSKDLIMRLSSKEEKEINTYTSWEQKAIRAKEMNDLSLEKFNLLANSFVANSSNENPNIPEDSDLEMIMQIIDQIKKILMEIINLTVANLVHVQIFEYANENEIKKGGIN